MELNSYVIMCLFIEFEHTVHEYLGSWKGKTGVGMKNRQDNGKYLLNCPVSRMSPLECSFYKGFCAGENVSAKICGRSHSHYSSWRSRLS